MAPSGTGAGNRCGEEHRGVSAFSGGSPWIPKWSEADNLEATKLIAGRISVSP
jgi:hypothetical protein